MSIGRDIPRPSQCMPALSRPRWPCTNAQCNVAPDDCTHSEFSVDCALLIGGEDQVFEIAAMVRKIDRAVQQPYSFCDVEGHGHLDTVHGLGRVDKQRNDVCTKCVMVQVNLATSFGNYGHGHRRSVLRARGGTWCDCMKTRSALRTCAEPSRQLCGNM